MQRVISGENMNKYLLMAVAFLSFAACSKAERINGTYVALAPSNLLVEDNLNPLNVHNTTPKLTWYSNVKKQHAYHVQVASSEQDLLAGQADLWNSGKVIDQRSVNIAYMGKALVSNQKAVWRVRVWPEGAEQPGQWSEPQFWEMGLLDESDWPMDWMQYAAFVHPNIQEKIPNAKYEKQLGVVEQLKDQPTASLFRHSFSLNPTKKIVKDR